MLLTLHRTRKAYLFPKTEQSVHNPLLVDCEPIRSLINNWLHKSDHCAFASNGLMYPDAQTMSGFGPGGTPGGRMSRAALLAGGVTNPRQKRDESWGSSDFFEICSQDARLFRVSAMKNSLTLLIS